MYGAQYRNSAYDRKVNVARLTTDLTALLPAMTLAFTADAPNLCLMEDSVKQTCDASGVATIQYPFYLDFGREMYRSIAKQQMSGESLAQLAAIRIAKWTARGLTQVVLQAIRTDVFNVAAPIAP